MTIEFVFGMLSYTPGLLLGGDAPGALLCELKLPTLCRRCGGGIPLGTCGASSSNIDQMKPKNYEMF